MTRWTRIFIKTGVAAGACLILAGYASYHHVLYYTGDTPRTYSCYSCHVEANSLNPLDRLNGSGYYSPLHLALSDSGKRLYVTAQSGDSLIEVDLDAREVSASIPVGRQPHDVVLSRNGQLAYVSNEWSDTISVVELDTRRVRRSIPTGNMPSGLALTADEKSLYVANWQGDTLTEIDLQSGAAQLNLSGGGSPNQLALSPDGRFLLATNELAYLSSRRRPPESEITLINLETRRTSDRIVLQNAHLIQGVAFLPEEPLALVTLVKPKNLLPVIHVERGWTMTNGIGVIDLVSGRSYQFLLDEVDRYYADPYDIVASPDGRYAFVSHSGVDRISVIDLGRIKDLVTQAAQGHLPHSSLRLDLSSTFVVKRIETSSNPKGLLVSPDGRYLYVAERLSDSILAIRLETLEPEFRIHLGGSRRENAIRRGEKLFNSGTRTFQGQFSCQSCHPRNHTDRLAYDFEPDGLGRNIVDNRSLLGIGKTAPFKWNGKNTSLFMQCGLRFSRILTRVDSFTPEELSDLVAFIRSLPTPPNPHRSPEGTLTSSQRKGKFFYERTHTKEGELIPESNRCITCHPPPLYTNRKSADVGSGSPEDSTSVFDIPHLNHIYASAPYLHDGKARTLEEIWTLYNADDTHGHTRDMSNQDLNDLIEYMKTF